MPSPSPCDQFLTDDAEESAKEAFYREGLKLPRPCLAKLFRWAAFGDWWDAYALVKVPTLVIGGRVSKVPVKIAQGIHEAIPGSLLSSFLRLTKVGATRCSGKVLRSTTTHCARS